MLDPMDPMASPSDYGQPAQADYASTQPVADVPFWRGELEAGERQLKTLHPLWDEDVRYYNGESDDASKATANGLDWVNVNVDYYETELKQGQLFFENPELQLTAKGAFASAAAPVAPGQQAPPVDNTKVIHSHRMLLNELIGSDHADVLTCVNAAIKDCLTASGFGATMIGYKGTFKSLPAPVQPGSILGLQQDVKFPVHESWYWDHFSCKKFGKPADFIEQDFDKAPWLSMRFRMPEAVAKRELNLPTDYANGSDKDEHVLDPSKSQEASTIKYIDGTIVFYRAALFDADVIHPELFRQHVLVDGCNHFCEKKNESPYHELGPDGRLTADSMRGNPIHVLTLRDAPDQAFPKSDARMRRPLVRELCKFRTQMIQTRDANRPRFGVDGEKLPPDTLQKLVAGQTGDIVILEGGALAQGKDAIIVQLTGGTMGRETFVGNDYVMRDIEKMSGIDASGAGVNDQNDESATKTAVIDRNRNVRINKEQRAVLRWYLKGVAKFSANVCRFMTPQLAVPYVGQEQAQVWGSWNKKANEGRLVFDAKPDSQLHLDAAAARKDWMQMYQFCAKDPNVIRVAVLKKLFELHGEDPSQFVVDQLPPKNPDLPVSLRLDLSALYDPIGRALLADAGWQIPQDAIDQTASQHFKQVAMGLRDVSGKALPPKPRPAEHGGVVDRVHPISKHSADQTGERPGAPTMVGAQ